MDTVDDDISKIRDESKRVVGLSLSSTERSVKLVEEMKVIGPSINSKLYSQGEKLRSVDRTNVSINTDLDTATKDVRVISGLGGYIRNALSRKKKVKTTYVERIEPPREESKEVLSPSITRRMIVEGEFRELGFEVEEQMIRTEDNLDVIFEGVTFLKGVAKDMGDEIDRHNTHLCSLNVSVTKTEVRTRKISDRVGREY